MPKKNKYKIQIFIKCNRIDFDSISDILISSQIRIHLPLHKLNGQEEIIAQNNRLPMIVLQISLKLVKMEHFMILLPDHVALCCVAFVSLWCKTESNSHNLNTKCQLNNYCLSTDRLFIHFVFRKTHITNILFLQ